MNWELIKWLLTFWKSMRTAYPKTKWGVRLCLAALTSGMFSIGVLNVQFESGFIIDTLGLVGQEPSLYSMYLSVIMAVIGSALIYSEWNQTVRHTAKVLISSLPGQSLDFPNEVLDPTEKEFCREPMVLGVSQISTEDVEKQIRRYNAELEVEMFKRHILHEKCQKLYIGGLARVPFLVSYGAMLRNTSAKIIYFEKFHRDGKFALLDEPNKQISLNEISLNEKVSPNGDVGIAIGFTTPIHQTQLPESIREFTTIISSSSGSERNLIKSQDNLHQLSDSVTQFIDAASALPGCKKVHLFLSVQSTFAIEIGRRFQEGVHKNWVIHNFDPITGTYNWALELSKSGLTQSI